MSDSKTPSLLGRLEPAQLRALLASILIILAIFTVDYSLYYYAQVVPERALNNAQLNITRFDFVDASANEITVNGTLEISGLPPSLSSDSASSNARITRVDIELSYDSLQLAGLHFPVTDNVKTETNNGSTQLDFTTVIQVNTDSSVEQENQHLQPILGALFSNATIQLQAKGTVSYQKGMIHQTLDIDNSIFISAFKDLDFFTIRGLNITDPESNTANMILRIYNPFSIPISISGTLNLLLENKPLAVITPTSPIELEPGNSTVQLEADLINSSIVTIQRIFQDLNADYQLQGNVTFSIKELTIETTVDAPIYLGSDLLRFELANVTDIQLNETTNQLNLKLDLFIINNSPMSFNLSSIWFNATTITQEPIGEIFWNSTQTLPLNSYSTSLARNITLEFTELSFSVIFQLLSDQAFSIPEGFAILEFYGSPIYVNFRIDSVPLKF